MLANKLKVGWHVDFRATERSALYIKGAIYVNKWDMRTHEVAYLLNPAFAEEFYIQLSKLIMKY